MNATALDPKRFAAVVKVACGSRSCSFPECACADTPSDVRRIIAAWETSAPSERKIVQMTCTAEWTLVLASDGTLWDRDVRVPEGWVQLPPLPDTGRDAT